MMCYVTQLKLMTVARRDILSVQIKPDLKEKLKRFAEAKRWSMSQSAEYLIEQGLSEEIDEPEATQPSKNSKTR